MKVPVDGSRSFARGVLSPKSTAAPRPLTTPRGRPGTEGMSKATPPCRSRRGERSARFRSSLHGYADRGHNVAKRVVSYRRTVVPGLGGGVGL